MKRHTQTSVCADPDWLAKGLVPGNCLQASVASWLSLDMEDVPHFVADERPGPGWWEAMRTWARETRGEDFAWATPDDPAVDTLRKAIEERGLWGGLVLASGRTVRDTQHMVVVHAADLSLAWDPHPSRAGLVEMTDVMWLCAPYDPTPEEQYAAAMEEVAA